MDDDASDAQPPKLFTSDQPQTMPPPIANVDATKVTSNAGLLQESAAGHNDAQQTQK